MNGAVAFLFFSSRRRHTRYWRDWSSDVCSSDLQLNIPLLVGGAVNWYVTSRSKDEKTNAARGERGTLIASGFIAGGALMGVVSALLRFGGFNPISEEWLANPLSEICSLVAYVCLILFFVWQTKKAKA